MNRICLMIAFLLSAPAWADDDDIASEKRKAGDDANKEYFLIGASKDRKAPVEGFGLVIIMPGGDGSAEFHPFVKRIAKHGLPEGYLAAQPVAVKWTDDQEIVWPTSKLKVDKMKFTTEEFVAAVIDDVSKLHKVNPKRTYTLSWSSSGPPAYLISMQEKPIVAGSFIAMSVFKPDLLPDLKSSKGHAYYLYHSPDDRVCPHRMAVDAEKKLKEAGAAITLKSYEGGHGWRGDVFGEIKTGMEWLEKHTDKKK